MKRALPLLVLAAAALLYCRRDADPDIILVTLDTLRADAVNAATTPFLAQLAREGIAFENAHAHNVVTLPSHTNILTGLLPYQHGVRDNAGFSLENKAHAAEPLAKQTTIAGALRERGYATGAFVAAYPLDSHFGLDTGFDVYDDEYPKTNLSGFMTPERPAGQVLAAAQQWYDSVADRKKFLWLHLYEPHAPYEPPSPFRERFPDKPYLGEVAAMDDALGRFLRPILERRPKTLLIVTSDHGEAFGEHGENFHGLFAYEETLKVPLIVVEKDRIVPRVEKSFVRHIDIAPTILARLGIAKSDAQRGESLLELKAPRDTYFEALWGTLNLGWAPLVGMIHDGHKYVDLPIAELYDLPRDPRERQNLLEQNRRMTTRIRGLLAAAAPQAQNIQRNVTPDEQKNLLSLGYLTGTAAAKKSYTAADDPKNLVPLHTRMSAALEHQRRGELDQAIAVAEELVRERPEMAHARDFLTAARNAHGVALADRGRGAEAAQQFERVLELDPDNAAALQNLGIVALQAGDANRAGRLLARAVQLNEKLPRALNALGVVYARQNDFPRAINAWQRAVALDPQQYDALFNLGLVAGRAGRHDEARRALTQFVNTAPPARYARDIAAARQALASLR